VRSAGVTTGQGPVFILPTRAAWRQSLMRHVNVLSADHPSFGATAADEATEEHAAPRAANAVLVAGHIAANPVPHHVLP